MRWLMIGSMALLALSNAFCRPLAAVSEDVLLTLPSGVAGDDFGFSVELDGNFLFVGSPGFGGSGAVLVYNWTGADWQLVETLQPADAASGDRFGRRLDLDGSTFGCWCAWCECIGR